MYIVLKGRECRLNSLHLVKFAYIEINNYITPSATLNIKHELLNKNQLSVICQMCQCMRKMA